MEEGKSKNKLGKLIIGAVVLTGILVYGIFIYLNSKNYESTDNAQLDADLLSVRAGISGYVSAIRFRDNQEVKKGDTLIIFDTAEAKAEISRIRAELENAKLNVGVSASEAKASLQDADAAFYRSKSDEESIRSAEVTYKKALTDLNRAKQLLNIKAITQDNFERLQTEVDVTRAVYARAKAQQRLSSGNALGQKTRAVKETQQVQVAKNVIIQKQAALDAAEEHLKHAYVIAPFDGLVTKRSIQNGQYVTTGQALCALINHKELWVTANFKETQLHKIKPGQKVAISLDAFEDIRLTGIIDSYGGATGARFALVPPDNATGNFIKIAQRFPVRIKLDRPYIENSLYPGLSAVVKVKVN